MSAVSDAYKERMRMQDINSKRRLDALCEKHGGGGLEKIDYTIKLWWPSVARIYSLLLAEQNRCKEIGDDHGWAEAIRTGGIISEQVLKQTSAYRNKKRKK